MKSKQVMCSQLKMRVISLKVTGTGTAAVSGTCANDVTLTDNGTGDYSLTFANAYKRAPEVIATAVTDNIYCKIISSSTTAVRIGTENLSGTATDAVFHVVILGSDNADQI